MDQYSLQMEHLGKCKKKLRLHPGTGCMNRARFLIHSLMEVLVKDDIASNELRPLGRKKIKKFRLNSSLCATQLCLCVQASCVPQAVSVSSTFPQLLPRRQSRAGAIVLEGQTRFTLPRSKTPLSDLFPTLSRVRGVSVWSQLSPNRCRDKGAEKAGSLYRASGDHAKLSPKVTLRACGPPAPP